MDGSIYNLYYRFSVGLPDIGTPDIMYWYAVREKQRTSGRVDTGKIYDAWFAAGLNLETAEIQIVGTEGYYSEGKSTVTVLSPRPNNGSPQGVEVG
jgi:hypothetical protein